MVIFPVIPLTTQRVTTYRNPRSFDYFTRVKVSQSNKAAIENKTYGGCNWQPYPARVLRMWSSQSLTFIHIQRPLLLEYIWLELKKLKIYETHKMVWQKHRLSSKKLSIFSICFYKMQLSLPSSGLLWKFHHNQVNFFIKIQKGGNLFVKRFNISQLHHNKAYSMKIKTKKIHKYYTSSYQPNRLSD